MFQQKVVDVPVNSLGNCLDFGKAIHSAASPSGSSSTGFKTPALFTPSAAALTPHGPTVSPNYHEDPIFDAHGTSPLVPDMAAQASEPHLVRSSSTRVHI